MSKRLEMLDAVIAKGSKDPFVFYARAMELRSMGQGELALAAFDQVRSQFADYVPCYLMAGQLAIELGQSEQARQWLTQGIEKAANEGNSKAAGEMQTLLNGLG